MRQQQSLGLSMISVSIPRILGLTEATRCFCMLEVMHSAHVLSLAIHANRVHPGSDRFL